MKKELPINQRKYHAFLSHAHADNEIVDRIYHLLSEVANIPIWYDADYLTGQIASDLPKAINQCRNMIIVLSEASIKSGWVKKEYNLAMTENARFDDFKILPIRIDGCKVEHHKDLGFLETTKWIDLPNGEIDLPTAHHIIASIYYNDVDNFPGETKDIYISRTWRENEAGLANFVCEMLDEMGLRLIGDFTDQAGFDEGNRVESIISSCGGLVAILPHRGKGTTSKYMIEEIQIAQKYGLPCVIIADPEVELSKDLAELAININFTEEYVETQPLEDEIEKLIEKWKPPSKPHYVFFSTDFDAQKRKRNTIVNQLIERITSMSCLMGDKIREGAVQKTITQKISESFLMIADITEENINTLIEAGIARGAYKNYYLIAKGEPRSPPFMFRDQQVWYYKDDVELIGYIHRLVYPYRRRILNYELK
ncbi:toll/interleukin-1 receptor domain-containing protein [uncultured Methanobacterium sp.]|uniref:toll/interleukin-1 receptor domain-containing protein n=1 Tax=uncultured Methanobacterium sp. TaxID=176306 RepID=UPI002AA9163D|nr:toll/interleukin-1 receptor domain-containing protein [uncultured Methanobacterium sp.]